MKRFIILFLCSCSDRKTEPAASKRNSDKGKKLKKRWSRSKMWNFTKGKSQMTSKAEKALNMSLFNNCK